MNTGIVNDALALCLSIYNSTPPSDSWVIVNIARSSFPTFTYPNNTEIPTGFGYGYDNTPKLLKDEKVIEAMTPKRWYLIISTGNASDYDLITPIALTKGYFKKGERCNYYWKYKTYGDDYGPEPPGHYSVLINMDSLKKFYAKYNQTTQGGTSSKKGEENKLFQKRMLDQKLIESIKKIKLKRICVEINTTPDQNVLSLSQSIGEALKWIIYQKAKQKHTKLKPNIGLEALLDEVISKSYFKSNASNRFLKDFKNNFMKTQYDMVRHDEDYVPDIKILNPQIDALEHILKELVD